jgi:hypothetical protein
MGKSQMRFACLVILALASPAAAQTTATLVAVVQDESGGRLVDVAVTVRHVATGATRTVATGDDGTITLTGLAVGEYELRVTRGGFRPLVRAGLVLTVGEHASLVLTLQLGAVEVVTVSGAAPAVNTRSGELGFLVDQQTIEQIPVNGRNYTDLMSLQPMVTPFPNRDNGSVVAHGLAMSVNGQDPRANVYLLDGTLTNDFTNGPTGSAAGTALGMETIREFRVEANGYSAEFGRNVGGQVNIITKSGTNQLAGNLFEFHRNDALDAANYFDGGRKPDFTRNQFGGTLGGPVRANRLFYFLGYEALHENLGRTILTVVPDDDAREGILPSGPVVIDPAVRPYLLEFPHANGPNLGGGLARYSFPFAQRLAQQFLQGRMDYVFAGGAQLFGRYTLDDAEQQLPTDYPQFPRAFVSRNQFVTAEFRQVLTSRTLHTARFGYSRTRIGQSVEANTSQALTPFVPGRPMLGATDIGGLPRFGPQLSADVQLDQDVYGVQYDLTHTRGRHLLRTGVLVDHYRDREFNPTFSLGVFRFLDLSTFLRNRPASFIGLTPEGDLNRAWNWTLLGAYVQDDLQLRRDVTLNAGLRLEGATMPRDPRDINMPDLVGPPVEGPLFQNPGLALSPRLGGAWNVRSDGRTSLRGGYGLYFKTSTQQDLIVTVTNPPATPRVVIPNPTFPVPPFERGGQVSVRPIQFDVAWPRVHMWNVNLQQELLGRWTMTLGYAGARGLHLWRNADVNVPTPTMLDDGTPFYPPNVTRPNTAFSAIELKSSDGNSWYRAFIVDLRRRWSDGLQVQSSYTWSRAEDTTQNATFFSDSTTSVVSALPEFIPDSNQGLADFHAEHHWVTNFIWQLPRRASFTGAANALLNGWQIAGIARLRSGNPLTVFVQGNRSRSLWSPSLGPGTGPDRPNWAPGRGPDNVVTGNVDQWLDPSAFVLQPIGTFGTVRRNEIIGPGVATVDLAFTKQVPWTSLGAGGRLDLRLEVFNVLNRVNLGPPALVVFSGTDNAPPFSSFGQIRTTTTSARQMQLGARVVF